MNVSNSRREEPPKRGRAPREPKEPREKAKHPILRALGRTLATLICLGIMVCSLAAVAAVYYAVQATANDGNLLDLDNIELSQSSTVVATDPDTGETKMIGGGGELGLPELQPAEGVKNTYYHAFTAQELDSIVRGNGCTVLYIQTLDDIFVQSYADLFTDKLAAAQSGETLLYRVTDAGYAPVEMQGGAA